MIIGLSNSDYQTRPDFSVVFSKRVAIIDVPPLQPSQKLLKPSCEIIKVARIPICPQNFRKGGRSWKGHIVDMSLVIDEFGPDLALRPEDMPRYVIG